MRADDCNVGDNPDGDREWEDRPDPALGDGRGFHIGHPKQQPGGVVSYDPTLPKRQGACALVGDLGRGKSVSVADLGGGGTNDEKGG